MMIATLGIIGFLITFNILNTESNFIEKFSIGKSYYGQDLIVYRLGLNPDKVGVPNVKLIGGIHGNAPTGTKVLFRLIEEFENLYENNDTEIINILETVNVFVLPLLNPDGYSKAQKGLCDPGPGRTNGRGVDLNRNFPTTYPSDMKPPENETAAVIKWMLEKHFMLSLSLTSGATFITYPYEVSKTDKHQIKEALTDDDPEFKYLAHGYKNDHLWMEKYKTCLPHPAKDHVINGAAWFPSTGTMGDYNYDFHGCLEIMVGLSCCRYDTDLNTEMIAEENIQPILNFIKQANKGIRGIVSHNGEPVAGATVTIMSRSMEHKTTSRGEYWRFLLPGKYFLQVEKYGFKTLVQSFVLTEDNNKKGPLIMNIHLELDEENNAMYTEEINYNNEEEFSTQIQIQRDYEHSAFDYEDALQIREDQLNFEAEKTSGSQSFHLCKVLLMCLILVGQFLNFNTL